MFDFKVMEKIVFGVTMTISTLQTDGFKYSATFLPMVIIVDVLTDSPYDICWYYTELGD